MSDSGIPLLTAAVALPAAAAFAIRVTQADVRRTAVAGAAGATLCAVEVFRQVHAGAGTRVAEHWPFSLYAADALNATFLLLYCLLTLGVLILAPRRDMNRQVAAATLMVLAGTLSTYAADNAIVLAASWAVSAMPFLAGPLAGSWRPRAGLAVSCVALASAIGIIAKEGNSVSLATLQGHNYGGPAAFALLMVAIICRKGIFPAHAWIEDAAEDGHPLLVSLFINGHLGAFLLARVVIPEFPSSAEGTFPILSDLALVTALYAAVRAIGESSARRILALLVLSQSACILAGLESGTREGIAGALVHCIVVAVATGGLFSVLRLMEVRFGRTFRTDEYLGLAQLSPRLAVVFGVCGLALVGLPGTLGFASEDLLIHGTLESHPQIGLLLPIATAMNAVSLFRLFSRIFLGRRRNDISGIPDAIPRERWVLTAILVFVVAAGLAPGPIVTLRTRTVQEMSQAAARETKRTEGKDSIDDGLKWHTERFHHERILDRR